MNIPETGTILAPSSQHLQLYEAIYKQHGNCIGISVQPMEGFISNLAPAQQDGIRQIYELKEKLKDLPESNAFYNSKADYDFLKSILQFTAKIKQYKVTDLPETNQKYKDLKVIVDKAREIHMLQDDIDVIKNENIDFDNIYILKTELSPSQSYWADFLIQNGAHWLESDKPSEKHYWSAANSRKTMEVVAETILNEQMALDTVAIALANWEERYVLEQILESRGIKYSYLTDQARSDVPNKVVKFFDYLKNPSKETELALISALDTEAKAAIDQYQELFPLGSNLQNLEYEPNLLLSEGNFAKLKELEASVKANLKKYNVIHSWSLDHLEESLESLTDFLNLDQEENEKAFDSMMKTISNAYPLIKDKEDLELLSSALKAYESSRSSKEISGVTILKRKEISPIRPVTFFVGAHAKNFPNYSVENGLFDESYLADTSYPSLKERLASQKAQLEYALNQPEKLYVVVPQAEYAGKSLELSNDLNQMMPDLPAFQAVKDPNQYYKPDFEFDEKQVLSTLAPNQIVELSQKKLNDYDSCPLRYYLKNTLKLYDPKDPGNLFIPANIISQILLDAYMVQRKNYQQLCFNDILSLLNDQFAFYEKVFPDKKLLLTAKKYQLATQIKDQLSIMDEYLLKNHIDVLNQDYEVKFSVPQDDIQADFSGSLVMPSISKATNMTLMADAALLKECDAAEVSDKPIGIYQLETAPSSYLQEAIVSKIGRGTATNTVTVENEQEAFNSWKDQTFKGSWKAKDIDPKLAPSSPALQEVNNDKKIKTFEAREQDVKDEMSKFINCLNPNALEPVHQEGACKHCPFNSICRNAKKQAVKAS